MEVFRLNRERRVKCRCTFRRNKHAGGSCRVLRSALSFVTDCRHCLLIASLLPDLRRTLGRSFPSWLSLPLPWPPSTMRAAQAPEFCHTTTRTPALEATNRPVNVRQSPLKKRPLAPIVSATLPPLHSAIHTHTHMFLPRQEDPSPNSTSPLLIGPSFPKYHAATKRREARGTRHGERLPKQKRKCENLLLPLLHLLHAQPLGLQDLLPLFCTSMSGSMRTRHLELLATTNRARPTSHSKRPVFICNCCAPVQPRFLLFAPSPPN